MTATWTNQHSRLPEEDWYPHTLEDLLDLRNAVIDAGVSARTADRLVAWVLTRSAGEPDETAPNTRSGYRKVLAALPGPGPSSPDRGRKRGDRGASHLSLVAGLAGASAAGSLAASGAQASASLAVAAVLYVTGGYVHYRPFVVVIVALAPADTDAELDELVAA